MIISWFVFYFVFVIVRAVFRTVQFQLCVTASLYVDVFRISFTTSATKSASARSLFSSHRIYAFHMRSGQRRPPLVVNGTHPKLMLLASCSLPFLLSEETLFLQRQIHWITWSSDERRCKSCPSWDAPANDENGHVATKATYPAATWQPGCFCAHEPNFWVFSQRTNLCFVSVSLLHSAPLRGILNGPRWRKI